MITGHNTDVDYRGRTYHVQTEDRGDERAVVESLVYCQGEILGTRRTDYAAVLGAAPDPKAIAALLEKQHERLIREIRNGLWAPEGPRLVGEELLSACGFEEVAAEFLASDPGMERVHLVVEAKPALKEGSASRLRVRALENGDPDRPAAATIVSVRKVARGRPPVLLAEGETDASGWFESDVCPDGAEADTAALVIASGATGGGQVRVPIKKPSRK